MTHDEQLAIANLSFFKSTVLDPVIELYTDLKWAQMVVPAICVVEAALWLRRGAAIRYFDGDSAFELLGLYSDGLIEAWSQLVESKVIAPEDTWCDFISFGQPPTLDKKRFLLASGLKLGESDYSRISFEDQLLLVSDTLSDVDAVRFLEGIGWSSSHDWVERLEGMKAGGIESLYVGFAKVLDHMQCGLELQVESGLRVDHPTFTIYPGLIQGKRFNLGQEHIRQRYFALAGSVAARIPTADPLWLDIRRSLFNDIFYLVDFWQLSSTRQLLVGGPYWDVYIAAIASKVTMYGSSKPGSAQSNEFSGRD